MHRQTPLTAGFVGYTSGGARTLIDTIDDDKMMQEMKGSMMYGEARDRVESPQNYGFTSVVRPATKGKDGQIEESAEGFMSFMGGNRSFPVCSIMDDRRYRPYGLKPGENAQYDDLGQMTLMRRNGLYLLTNDNDEDKQQSQSGGAGAGQQADSGEQKPERFVSIRHVEKKKQERKKNTGGQDQGGSGGGTAGQLDSSGGQSGGQSKQDFKHEGESVNNEMRVTKKRIEFRSGDDVVGYYDKGSKTWCFIGNVITLQADQRCETIGKTYLGLDSKGENAPQVVTIDGTAKQTYAKVG